MQRRAVAENKQLARVFCDVKAPALHLTQKSLHTDKPLHIPPLASDHTALLHCFAGEKVMQPDFGRERRVAVLHVPQGEGYAVKGELLY